MNKNSPLNQRYICPIGADGVHSRRYLPHKVKVLIDDIKNDLPGEIEALESLLENPPDTGEMSPTATLS